MQENLKVDTITVYSGFVIGVSSLFKRKNLDHPFIYCISYNGFNFFNIKVEDNKLVSTINLLEDKDIVKLESLKNPSLDKSFFDIFIYAVLCDFEKTLTLTFDLKEIEYKIFNDK